MKVWTGYGSEHSFNLVIVGRFKRATDARAVQGKLERLRALAQTESANQRDSDWEESRLRISSEALEVMKELNLFQLSAADVECFGYEHSLDVQGKTITIKTDEIEVLGILKVLIDGDARLEVYSAHAWPEHGASKRA